MSDATRSAGPVPKPDPARRRKAATAVRLWAGLTLTSIVVLAALIGWHLVRRGRVLRASLGAPRPKSALLDRGGEPPTRY